MQTLMQLLFLGGILDKRNKLGKETITLNDKTYYLCFLNIL